MRQMAKHLLQVRDFHAANHQHIAAAPSIMPREAALLRVRLMNEELGEFSCALHENNLVGSADGLTDFLYVVFGTCISSGTEITEKFIEFLEDKHIRAVVGNEHILEVVPARDKLDILMRLSKSLAFVNVALTDPDQKQIDSCLESLVVRIYQVAGELGLPMRALFDEVHRSNMTKNLGGATNGAKYGNATPKGAAFEPPDFRRVLGLDDISRCAICGWPLKVSADQGCVVGNCSHRPAPPIKEWYAPTRAKLEREGGSYAAARG